MVYEPHTWVANELITHEKLNNMENGIANAGSSDSGSGVGQSMAGKEVKPTSDTTVTAKEGAEIFNDYKERTFYTNGEVSLGNVSSEAYSHAEGSGTTASGYCSHAENNHTTASGTSSHSGGAYSIASGDMSFAHGNYVIAADTAQFVVGYGNVETHDYATMFIVGSGQNNLDHELVRANCFRATRYAVYGSGAYNSSGADYAELFEWADSNPTNEDRRGLFVTLNGEHIRIAKPGDKNIIGIVSGNPTVVGDVYDDQWQGMYVTDVFGSPILEDVKIPDQTEERLDHEHPGKTITEVIIPAHTEHRQKLNPNYDNTQKYKARTNRPEWAPVGLIGKLVAIDDGTCEPGGYCTVGYDDGVATSSYNETKYYVMSRIDNTHIRVFIKAH